MTINHPAVTSDVFKLLSTLEFDLEIKEHFLPTRIELFQNTECQTRFRCRMWERDLYRLKPFSVKSPSPTTDINEESDEEILVERTWELSDDFEDFEAESSEAAIQIFLNSLEAYLSGTADKAVC